MNKLAGINVGAMRATAALLRSEERKTHFYMGSFGGVARFDDNGLFLGMATIYSPAERECDTAACVAGHALIASIGWEKYRALFDDGDDLEKDEDPIVAEASQQLGLSSGQWEVLFLSFGTAKGANRAFGVTPVGEALMGEDEMKAMGHGNAAPWILSDTATGRAALLEQIADAAELAQGGNGEAGSETAAPIVKAGAHVL